MVGEGRHCLRGVGYVERLAAINPDRDLRAIFQILRRPARTPTLQFDLPQLLFGTPSRHRRPCSFTVTWPASSSGIDILELSLPYHAKDVSTRKISFIETGSFWKGVSAVRPAHRIVKLAFEAIMFFSLSLLKPVPIVPRCLQQYAAPLGKQVGTRRYFVLQSEFK